MKMRILYLLGCGLVLAGIIHIAVILLIPSLGGRDAARQILLSSEDLQFQVIQETDKAVRFQDPFFQTVSCKFTLSDSAVFVSGGSARNFWSAVVYDGKGRVVYSMNKRTAIGNKLQMLIVNPIQMAALRQLQPVEIETSIVVETSVSEGFILVRSLAPDESQKAESLDFVKGISCQPYSAT
jgi:uncharacterized membrane protein